MERRPRSNKAPHAKGALAPLILNAIIAPPLYYEVVGEVTNSRENHWLSNVPAWANPLEHINNSVLSMVLNSSLCLGLAATAGLANPKERSLRRVINTAMFAGIAMQGFGEFSPAQPLIAETHIFSSSYPDPVDFIYGSAATVALSVHTRRMVGRYYRTLAQADTGPAGLSLVTSPEAFVSQTIFLPN